MQLTKSMLAAKLCEADLEFLRFPLLCSPKYDGVRCNIQGGQALSRSLKPIPNKTLQHDLSMLPTGLDGELVIPGRPFCETTSAVMGRDSDSKLVEYWVFDNFMYSTKPFIERATSLYKLPALYPKESGAGGWVRIVPQHEVRCVADVLTLEKRWLAEGYEGIILRAPDAPYKEGRSTVKEQGLLKLKRFVDYEVEIVGFVEQMHNENPAKRDATGKLKRSSAKTGKVGLGVLGALQVRDPVSGVAFEVGTGFDNALRKQLWHQRRKLLGRFVKVKHQESGAKDKPRFPIFLGFRDECDT